jgi:drug/metabolite transporter (DMT)-like permease
MPKPTRRAIKIVLVAAFFGMAWASLLFTYAVKLIGASVTTVLGSISPLFALPISIIFLKEKFTTKSIVGVLLTVSGIVLVVLI